MAACKVLTVVHGHPAERPGGAEVYAWEVYRAMRADPAFDPVIVTRTGTRPPGQPPVWADPHDPSHYWLAAAVDDFDFFYQEARTVGTWGPWFDRLVRRVAPDAVHFQHTLFLGLDLVRRVRAAAPAARIVYTLHEFLPICYHRGLMFKTHAVARCLDPSPAACHACFPDIAPESFAARTAHVLRRFDGVDAFIAPSRFLRDRFVEWGLPAERVVVEEYGRLVRPPAPEPPAPAHRTRVGYFGQLNAFKGVDVLLRAALHLADDRPPGFGVRVHGANLELQSARFQEAYRALLARAVAAGVAEDAGSYDQADLPRLMAAVDWVVVPSVWWENSPLVIQEAFMAGRPVIVSDIGGTGEKVAHGRDGLHFPAGDAAALARVLRAAFADPTAWDRLRSGIRPVHGMPAHLAALAQLYGR